jgi:hypothetical protein
MCKTVYKLKTNISTTDSILSKNNKEKIPIVYITCIGIKTADMKAIN